MAAPGLERLKRLRVALAGPRRFLEGEYDWSMEQEADWYGELLEEAIVALENLVDHYDRDSDLGE